MKTLLTFCLILIGLAGFTATGADAATSEHRTHARPAYYHHHHWYRHHHRHHHHRYYYRHHHRIYY